MRPPATTDRLVAFPDVAKIVAVVGVVTVHVDAPPNEGFHSLPDPVWLASTAVETGMRWCVPLFVMVSGMLLLGSRTTEHSLTDFYRRRASRVAIPLVGWTLFYRAFLEYTGPHTSFGNHVKAIYLGRPYYHLYFLYIIVGLYLACPFLARAIAGFSRRQLAGTAIGALLFGFLWGGVPPWLPGTEPNAFSEFAPFIGYFLAGYWLAGVRPSRRALRLCAGAFVALLVASTTGTYLLVSARGLGTGRYLYSYLSPPVIVMSICAFVIIRALTERREAQRPIRHMRALHYLGEATFGIFLIHPFFFTLWQERPPGVPHTAASLALWVPLTVAGLIAVSLACTLMLKQIPGLRRLV